MSSSKSCSETLTPPTPQPQPEPSVTCWALRRLHRPSRRAARGSATATVAASMSGPQAGRGGLVHLLLRVERHAVDLARHLGAHIAFAHVLCHLLGFALQRAAEAAATAREHLVGVAALQAHVED